MDLLKKLYRKEIKPDFDYFFLTAAVAVFTLLRIPSLFEPDWYGDEGIYQVIGRALVQGRVLYKGIWDNKPPMLYLYYALVNGDLFSIRLLSLLFGAGAVVTFYFVARTLFQKSKLSVMSSTGFFAVLFGLPLIEGNIANAENFMLFPVLLSLLFIIRLNSKSKLLFPVFSGLLLSLSFLTKIVALFDFTAFLVILLGIRFYDKDFSAIKKQFFSKPKQFLVLIKQEIVLGIFFIVPILLVFLFFLVVGGVPDFLKAAFSQNVGYVGYGNRFIIPQGLLILKLGLLGIGVLAALLLRKRLGPSGLAVYIWLFFSLFDAFFSGRPYTHYVLVALPAVSLLLGLACQKRVVSLFHGGMLVLALVLLWNNFGYYKKIIPYYKNYIDFTFGNKTVQNYQKFFDGATPRDYDIANFITANTGPNENVFLVTNSAQIYYLANKLPPGRYIVAYHMSFYNDAVTETEKALQKAQPKFIISTDDQVAKNFLDGYTLRYIVEGAKVYGHK
ncbi:MAG: ArnT family glycosyltransferase [Candidatus Levyibacteriota bacterium]